MFTYIVTVSVTALQRNTIWPLLTCMGVTRSKLSIISSLSSNSYLHDRGRRYRFKDTSNHTEHSSTNVSNNSKVSNFFFFDMLVHRFRGHQNPSNWGTRQVHRHARSSKHGNRFTNISEQSEKEHAWGTDIKTKGCGAVEAETMVKHVTTW